MAWSRGWKAAFFGIPDRTACTMNPQCPCIVFRTKAPVEWKVHILPGQLNSLHSWFWINVFLLYIQNTVAIVSLIPTFSLITCHGISTDNTGVKHPHLSFFGHCMYMMDKYTYMLCLECSWWGENDMVLAPGTKPAGHDPPWVLSVAGCEVYIHIYYIWVCIIICYFIIVIIY